MSCNDNNPDPTHTHDDLTKLHDKHMNIQYQRERNERLNAESLDYYTKWMLAKDELVGYEALKNEYKCLEYQAEAQTSALALERDTLYDKVSKLESENRRLKRRLAEAREDETKPVTITLNVSAGFATEIQTVSDAIRKAQKSRVNLAAMDKRHDWDQEHIHDTDKCYTIVRDSEGDMVAGYLSCDLGSGSSHTFESGHQDSER